MDRPFSCQAKFSGNHASLNAIDYELFRYHARHDAIFVLLRKCSCRSKKGRPEIRPQFRAV